VNNIRQKTFGDYSNLIGIPYEEKNCWDICRDFYLEILGVELKSYFDGVEVPSKEITNSLIYTNLGDFIRVEGPIFGDLVLMRIFGIDSHIGIYIGGGKLLHTSKATGSHIDRVSRLGKLITGYYRLRIS